MYRVIAGNDTGKTKKLLTECGSNGVFVCAHPERIGEKCRAYNIPIVKSIGYLDYNYIITHWDLFSQNGYNFYVDELEKFVNYMAPHMVGYTLTNE